MQRILINLIAEALNSFAANFLHLSTSLVLLFDFSPPNRTFYGRLKHILEIHEVFNAIKINSSTHYSPSRALSFLTTFVAAFSSEKKIFCAVLPLKLNGASKSNAKVASVISGNSEKITTNNCKMHDHNLRNSDEGCCLEIIVIIIFTATEVIIPHFHRNKKLIKA